MGAHDGGMAYTFYISQGGVPFCQGARLPARNRQTPVWGACLISKSAEPAKRASDEAKRASDEAKRASDEDAVVITLSEREQEIIDSMSGDKNV